VSGLTRLASSWASGRTPSIVSMSAAAARVGLFPCLPRSRDRLRQRRVSQSADTGSDCRRLRCRRGEMSCDESAATLRSSTLSRLELSSDHSSSAMLKTCQYTEVRPVTSTKRTSESSGVEYGLMFCSIHCRSFQRRS